ncbi:MAG: hypothetical protein WCK29_03235 [archaeon]
MINRLNKKGDIALTLTLILTFVLLLAGLYAFATDNRNFGDESKQIAMMFNTLNFDENYIKSEAGLMAQETLQNNINASRLKEEYQKIALTHKLGMESEGNLFSKIEHGDFRFENVSSEYIFEINGLVVVSKMENNQVSRTINYSIRLNNSQ